MFISANPVFNNFHLSFKPQPIMAGYAGTVETRHQSPVLSRQELQRLIREMVD